MRYREELKMYAAILDQNNSNRLNIPEPPLTPAMEDISFLDERHQIMKSDWPAGKERAVWWHALEVSICLCRRLHMSTSMLMLTIFFNLFEFDFHCRSCVCYLTNKFVTCPKEPLLNFLSDHPRMQQR